MARARASLREGWREGPSEEVTFELRPERMLPGPRGPGFPSSWSSQLRPSCPRVESAAEERQSVPDLGCRGGGKCSCFHQLSFHDADPLAGLSLRDGGGTRAGKSVLRVRLQMKMI